jgi:hypothetical protein
MSAPGKCRHCGCTEDNACILPTGDPCCWTNEDRNVCSRAACMTQERIRQERARRESTLNRSPYAGWGYGAIVADLRSKRRRGRKRVRKGRAA